ncbi:hypothetical protein [Cryobacterium tepidiphilum]|uniref:Uncharacterized protein n=1 Tax=Cryobacterium tepidiphilum TaxID=2486026 RepID=A0A3M8LRW5_9MICO|nr:hypothetical protein [Cryobacterium tepidiphilum]RNE67228.1 hypothetical protein EEJ31_00110 [Cryobacterium tepidiphilum]
MKLASLHKVSPRTAGSVTVLTGIILAVVAGFLIAHPPLSIPGAVLLVVGTILLCVGAIWRLKRTWSDPWPPYTAPDRRKQLRRLRILFVFNCVFLPVLLAGAIYSAINGQWWEVAFGLFIGISPALNIWLFPRLIRSIQKGPDPARGT